ncbi:MAG TPA: EamA family transporter [Phycisphaerae bacterium]|nr:EamA family transporter [Phycisphaerae bacterium]
MPRQPPSPTPKSRGVLALAITVFFWASAFAVIKSAVQEYGPGELATLRFTIAATALGIAALVKGVRRPRGSEICWFMATGFTGFSLYHPFLNYGEKKITAGTAALLINSAPVWTAILAALVLHEKVTFRKFLGISISFAGIALLVFGQSGRISLEPAALVVLTSAVCAAFYVTIQKKFLARFNALEFTFWSVFAGMLQLWPFFGISTVQTVARAPMQPTLEIVYLGIFPAAIAYMAFAYATVRMPASRVMTVMYITPPITMLMACAYPAQREWPTLLSVVGGVMAIAGVAVVNTARKEVVPVKAIEEG